LPFLGDKKISNGARTAVYVDGFNLYHGIVEASGYKWLDLRSMTRAILSSRNDIQLIRYFTSRISARPKNPDGPTKQDTYLRALKSHIPELEIHEGQFKSRQKEKWTVARPKQKVRVWITEEKGSDVNLAVHLVNDAWLDRFDVAVVVSNDSDLAEALTIVSDMGKAIGLLTAANRPVAELRSIADFHRRIKKHHLKNSQLPDPIPGTNIQKPAAW
jgi:uncharacterized LabA/DUF88 family protein